MTEHTCHAISCTVRVPPRMFMCRKHWFALPRAYQNDIWATYRPGQEVTKTPSAEYLAAAGAAIRYIERKEGRRDE